MVCGYAYVLSLNRNPYAVHADHVLLFSSNIATTRSPPLTSILSLAGDRMKRSFVPL